jgi:hypothetical protein
MNRSLVILALVVAATLGGGAGRTALAVERTPQAQLFATNNTAIITDPNDPRLNDRLVGFGHQVTDILDDGGAEVDGSTLLNGVFFDSTAQQITYERSREFDVEDVSATRLHDLAAVVRDRFHQESVLTFRFLPRSSPDATAIEVQTPGISVQQLHDALVADPAAANELGGGSVTLQGRLIEVAPASDLDLVKQLVAELGGSWAASTVRYGAEEFV